MMVFLPVGLAVIPFPAFPMTLQDGSYPPGLRLDDAWRLPLVFLIGLFPWVLLGARLSKNASFAAAWGGSLWFSRWRK
jgi:hypothetical protein